MTTEKCIVCEEPREHGAFCAPCRRSYDRNRYRDDTIYSIIAWAAKRARRQARKVKP